MTCRCPRALLQDEVKYRDLAARKAKFEAFEKEDEVEDGAW